MTTTSPSSEPEAHGSDGGQGGRRERDGRLRRVWRRRTARLAVGVVAAAVALTAAAVALAQGIGPFRDVGNNAFYSDSVEWAADNRITQGCRDGTYFCPERTTNRAESVTFLYRYHYNVVDPRLDIIEANINRLQSQPTTTPTPTPTTPTTVFVPAPTTTTVAPRTFVLKGTQSDTRTIPSVTGRYNAVLTLEVTKAVVDHDEPNNVPPSDCQDAQTEASNENVTLIQVEYQDRISDAWKTYAVSMLKLPGTGVELPATGSLFKVVPANEFNVLRLEDVPGRLPPAGKIRVSAYMADNAMNVGTSAVPLCDTDKGPDRTTEYAFNWGIVLTEIRPSG